jgi:hypothetical protein
MKALSLTECWASLMTLEEKRWETRSWKPSSWLLGNEVAIHAAKAFPAWAIRLTEQEPFCSSLRVNGNIFLPNLTRGKILCIVKFVEFCRTEDVRHKLSEKEVAFGNYSDGRFAFRAEFVRRLEEPVPVVGHLGFWEWKR